MPEFDNKVAIVTGTTGIGRAVALHLARQGASVAALGIDTTANCELQQLASAESLSLIVLTADVSSPEMVRDALAEAVAGFGGIDIIVNAAAVHPYGDATETSFEAFMRCMAVNVGGIHLTAQYAVPVMRARGGGVI